MRSMVEGARARAPACYRRRAAGQHDWALTQSCPLHRASRGPPPPLRGGGITDRAAPILPRCAGEDH